MTAQALSVPEELVADIEARHRYPEVTDEIAAALREVLNEVVVPGRTRRNLLRPCDADVLFVSFEPLIGPVAEQHDKLDLSGIDWAIVGGESGPNDARREMAHEWVWPIRRACTKQGVAFFFKQSSAARPEQGQALRCPDGICREFREMPEVNQAVMRARREGQHVSQ